MCIQWDGATAHYHMDFRNYFDAIFVGNGRGEPVRWTPQFLDLSNIEFFLRGHLKSIIYETPVESIKQLVARLSIAAYLPI